ncbi:MAG TPA: hypothetical protein VHO06_22680 [Polyangia bacterium]|nr:hypothetical protein [Polyangia bacterium]
MVVSPKHEIVAMALRAYERSRWPVARFVLGQEPADDLSATTTASERIAMMWPLAVEAWRLAGREIPTYARAETPTRLFRPGEARPEDE